MKRKIITIDEDKCNGCGECIPNCPEGAIQVIDGKARLVSELFCDGLGACLGHCPQAAIRIEEKEAQGYDEAMTMENVIKGGMNVIKAHLEHLRGHGQGEYLRQAMDVLKKKNISVDQDPSNAHSVCPGMQVLDFRAREPQGISVSSQLRQWPVQLKLLNPSAPYFNDADILIAADCVPFSFANFHQRFLKGKILIVFCPKLDEAHEEYIEKLTRIIKSNSVKSIMVAHMEVPCCFGTVKMVEEALRKSGKQITLKEYNISLQGTII
ncbi:MAG: 4Fe-4S dicluster domain-containing protein [Candidatus Omnitrophica bacterium]|nr:4Fe-4S dicluster domain-containing protein [Candidatus Omnitrophota bacterium]MBU4479766.1 4Fe-4S dicluster domain-containing protein [Candidatus Omnitrophota bacterium]MCG2703289.1 4Fe-4S dicluster domain-containing protein [Candidatus Omnitrophota bacterium]